MRRGLIYTVALAAVVAGAGLFLTRPVPLDPDVMTGIEGDAERGEQIFAMGGCASCHRAPAADDGPLTGGRAFESPFGTFYAPNISTDPDHGIGGWTDIDLAGAVLKGVSPEGQHYYPAFPYDSYVRAAPADVADLIAYLRTLPPDPTPSRAHDVGFPFNIRASLGGWKLLFVRPDWVVSGDLTDEELRGREIVEGLGHCGACHTPRNALGGQDLDRWLAGGPNPSGNGNIPNITPGALDWTREDIAAYLETGFTPEFDSAGGEMYDVVQNMSQLSDADRRAIAAYLKAVPAVE